MAEESPQSTVQTRMTEVFMLADTPWMAAVIFAAAQPFAQLGRVLHAPTWMPLAVAMLISVFIATYYVRIEQRSANGKSLLVIPVVTMLLFSASIGANNAVMAVRTGASAEAIRDTSASQTAVSVLSSQKQNLQEQLDLERKKSKLLEQALGMASDPAKGHAANAPRGWSQNLFSMLVPEAWAQPAPEAPPASTKPELLEQLKKLEEQQEKLRKEQKVLDKKDVHSVQPAPLWKAF